MAFLVGGIGLGAACASKAGREAASDASPPDAFRATGCATAPTHPVAPGGYYVDGNTVCTAAGRAHLFHGVDRPSLEWSSVGVNLSLADFQLMASWNANVVRVALNQDFWIAASPLFDPSYASLVDTAVTWAEAEGLDVILDLHWSDAGVLGSCVPTPTTRCQQQMPDANSVTFWAEVAARYRDDGRVMFELYNEPHDVSWSVWKSGGAASDGFQAVGMQQLYDTVRATGAHNLVIIGGLDWAYDLSGVPANRIDGYNIAYATHPYTPGRRPYDWDRSWGFLTATDPIVVTEFGVLDDATCATDYSAELIRYADAHAAGWTAWAWFPGGCKFPAIVDDWSATPSAMGAVVKAALLGYGDPPASPPGGRVPEVHYTFDHGTEGWGIGHRDDREGGVLPTLGFADAEGDPSAGALRLTATFTDSGQHAVADVDFAPPGLDLSGKTIHARVRLVSGTFASGSVALYACSAGSPCPAPPGLDAASLAAGVWAPLALDLGAAAPAGFDATASLEIGVQFLSGMASDGDTVFEIDTVTD